LKITGKNPYFIARTEVQLIQKNGRHVIDGWLAANVPESHRNYNFSTLWREG
jgi:hypothetical protein